MALQKHTFFRRKYLLFTGGFVAMLYSILTLTLPLPEIPVKMLVQPGPVDTGRTTSIHWPDTVQAAVGTDSHGVLATQGSTKAIPIASVAKIITALAIVRQKPLELDQSGSTITITEDDVALYESYLSSGGSVAPVVNGQRLTQYQALQLLLLPSGNNMAVTLSRWAFGSDAEYVRYANNMLKEMGLTNSYVADASGFSPQTVSNASELVSLGLEVLKHPVLAQIVNQKQAQIPGSGTITNTNKVLGVSYIDGIKTGTTLEAGSCLLFSATRMVEDQQIKIAGVVLGANNREEAFVAAPQLVEVSYGQLRQVTPIKAGQTVATVYPIWGESVAVKAQQDVKQVVWQGSQLSLDLKIKLKEEGSVGEASVGTVKSDLQLAQPLPKASILWRLTHPAELFRSALKQ